MCFTPSDVPSTTDELSRRRLELLEFLNDPKLPGASKAEGIAAFFDLLHVARTASDTPGALVQDFSSTDADDVS